MGSATRRCYARACCRTCVSARRPRPVPATCERACDPRQVAELEMMMVRLSGTLTPKHCAMDAQQSYKFEWLKRDGAGGFVRNTEHAVLTCMATLEKVVCCRQPARRWAPERAIVTFSDHVQSIVGRLVLSRLRWSRRRWNASTVRCRVACVCTERRFGPRQRFAADQRGRRGNTGSSCGTWARVARVVSRPKQWIIRNDKERCGPDSNEHQGGGCSL